MNLQEILEQNDLVMSINNNFNVLSFYIPEIECMVEFNQKQPQHLILKDLLDIIIMFRELLLRWLMLF